MEKLLRQIALVKREGSKFRIGGTSIEVTKVLLDSESVVLNVSGKGDILLEEFDEYVLPGECILRIMQIFHRKRRRRSGVRFIISAPRETFCSPEQLNRESERRRRQRKQQKRSIMCRWKK